MLSLAEFPDLIGFFSYAREDDENSDGAISAFRKCIERELGAQLGRPIKTFRLQQRNEAGDVLEAEIKAAVRQSVFFIPFITPAVARSPYYKFELNAFLSREAELARHDLIFPILYTRVPALEDRSRFRNDALLSVIADRQYVDWRELRHQDVSSPDVKKAIERFCRHVCDALCLPWNAPFDIAALNRKRQEPESKHATGESKSPAGEPQVAGHSTRVSDTAFDVFISYPHENKTTADAVCAKLEAEGIGCWIAPRDITPSADWASSIVEAIDGCRVMVLIFSGHANRSKQVQREVQQAFDGDKPVVPFRIENVTPENALRYYMGPLHWLDALTPPMEKRLEELVISIQGLVGASKRLNQNTASESPTRVVN